MNYREVIRSAWVFTQSNKRLIIWYSFLPGILTTLVGILYVLYQYFAFLKSPLFSETHGKSFTTEVFEFCLNFIKSDYQTGLIIAGIVVILGLIWFFLPTICQGSLIQLTARMKNKQDVKLIDGVYYGLKSFLPLFEYHTMIKGFSLVTFFTEAGFVARNLGVDWFKIFLVFFIFFSIIGFILSILFTYTEYFVVIDGNGVFASIGKSCSLVLKHWRETFLILIMMLIITVQIILRLILIILLPALILLSTAFFASVMLETIGIIIGITIGFIMMIFAAYFTGIVHVFAVSVWVTTFLRLTAQEEKSAREVEA